MLNFLLTFSTPLLQVFFVLTTGLLPSTSSSICIALLSMLFSSICFTWPNHLNLSLTYVLQPTSSSDLFISNPVLPSYSWHVSRHSMIKLASNPSSLSISPQVSESKLQQYRTSHTHSKPSLFPLVECFGLLASLPIPSIYSNHWRYPIPYCQFYPSSTWNHIIKITKPVHYFQIIFSHLQSPWHCHNSLHTCWKTKVIPGGTTFHNIDTILGLLQFLCCKPHMGNLPFCGLTAGSLPITINLVLIMFTFNPQVSIFFFHTPNFLTASSSDSEEYLPEKVKAKIDVTKLEISRPVYENVYQEFNHHNH